MSKLFLCSRFVNLCRFFPEKAASLADGVLKELVQVIALIAYTGVVSASYEV